MHMEEFGFAFSLITSKMSLLLQPPMVANVIKNVIFRYRNCTGCKKISKLTLTSENIFSNSV